MSEEKREEVEAFVLQRVIDMNYRLQNEPCPLCGRPFKAAAVKTACCGRLIGWTGKRPLRRKKVSR
jgi:hypothetical protein